MSELSLKSLENKLQRTSGIAFVMQNPIASQQSAPYMLKTAKTINEVTVLTNTIPTASTVINIFKNGTQVATLNITTPTTIIDITDISCIAGDVICCGIGTAVNGITLITIELTAVDA
jgi:hypothetical protein